MLAACPFPANHGTPGSIREMAEAVSDLGHEVHVVTYHFGEEIPVRGPRLHRVSPWLGESAIVVGPTTRRPLYDLQMVFKTLEVIRKHRPALIHAHGYEAALVARICRVVSGLPVLYSGHNTMADELPSYRFIRPNWLWCRDPQLLGSPIKLLNYMAARKPCVLFASSASTGLIHGRNVFLAAPDTSMALGQTILELLRDADQRQQLSHNGYCYVREHHNRSSIAKRICAAYFRTVGSR